MSYTPNQLPEQVPVNQQSSVDVVAMYKRIIKKHGFKTILFLTGYKGGGNC